MTYRIGNTLKTVWQVKNRLIGIKMKSFRKE